jgi:hypothetical protein
MKRLINTCTEQDGTWKSWRKRRTKAKQQKTQKEHFLLSLLSSLLFALPREDGRYIMGMKCMLGPHILPLMAPMAIIGWLIS